MNILEVHEVNYLTKPVFEFIEIPEALSIRGHDVTMVDYGEGDTKLFSLGTQRFRGNRVFKKARVEIVRPGAIYLNDMIGRFTNMFTSFFVLWKLFATKKFDAVILYSVPTNGWQTIFLSKLYKVPVFFRTLDVLYDLRPFPFPIKQIVKVLENSVYKNCDYMLALTPRLGMYTKRPDYLPLYPAVNTNIFYPMRNNDPRLARLRKKHVIKKKDILITYIGTFYEFGGLEIFIQNLQRIRDRIPNAKLLYVGGGSMDDELKKLAMDLGVENNVIFTGFVSYSDVASYINLSTVCINSFRQCKVTKDIIPAKLFQYLGCRKSIISRRLKGILDIIPDKGFGVVFSKTDSDLIDDTIKLLNDKVRRSKLEAKGYEFTMKNHSWNGFVDKIESYLKKFSVKP